MSALQRIHELERYAKAYRKTSQDSILRNRHMNELKAHEVVDQRHIDATLVDFINWIGLQHRIDYALYTEDLNESES